MGGCTWRWGGGRLTSHEIFHFVFSPTPGILPRTWILMSLAKDRGGSGNPISGPQKGSFIVFAKVTRGK